MRNYKELKHEKNGNVTEKVGKNKGKSKAKNNNTVNIYLKLCFILDIWMKANSMDKRKPPNTGWPVNPEDLKIVKSSISFRYVPYSSLFQSKTIIVLRS